MFPLTFSCLFKAPPVAILSITIYTRLCLHPTIEANVKVSHVCDTFFHF